MALSTKILGYGGTLVAASAIWAIGISPIVSRGTSIAINNSTIPEAATGARHVQAAADWSGLLVLLILGVGLVAAAVYRSERR